MGFKSPPPYGQPDRKISVFFFDDFPYHLTIKSKQLKKKKGFLAKIDWYLNPIHLISINQSSCDNFSEISNELGKNFRVFTSYYSIFKASEV